MGAIWVAAAAVYQNQRVNSVTNATLKMAQGIRALYATQVDTTGLVTSAAVNAGIIPSDFMSGANTTNPWGGVVNVLASTDAGKVGFDIQFTKVPQDACIKLLSSVAGTVRDSGLASTTKACGTAGTSVDASALLTTALTPLTTGCVAGDNVIDIAFKLK